MRISDSFSIWRNWLIRGSGRDRGVTNRNGQPGLPSSDLVHIYLYFGSSPSPLLHPDFCLAVTAYKTSEGGNGGISFEDVNFLGNFKDFPRLKSLVFILVRSGIPEAIVAVATPLQGGSSLC